MPLRLSFWDILARASDVEMKSWPLIDHLFRPHLYDSPTEPKVYSRSQLLTATGITSRQLSYLMQKGAVARPIGKTRAARYTISHLHQVQRAVELMTRYQTTVSEIAEAYASRTPGARAIKQPSAARPRSAERQIVHRLTDGVRVVVDEDLLPTEKKLLTALLKVGAQLEQDRMKLLDEVLTREQRLKDQVTPNRRRTTW